MLRVRRLYFYLVLYISLSMLLTGLATLGRVLLEQALGAASSGVVFDLLAGREHFREQTALGIALVAIGLPVWALHWRAVLAWLAGPEAEQERRSGLRRLYLYGVLLTTALTAYLAARDLLEHLLGLPLGLSTGSERVAGLARPLPYLVVAALFWAYHWRLAAADRAAVQEVGAGATLRRWYLYLMAVFGVVPLMVNLSALGQQAWTAAFGRSEAISTLGPSTGVTTIMSATATALVALVVWLAHRAWSDRATVVTSWYGENERHSVLRKVYLYAVVLGTVGWLLVNAAQLLYFALSTSLGVQPETPGGQPVLVALGEPLVNLVVAGLFWVYYWRVVVADAAVETEVGRQASVRRIYYYIVAAVALAFLAAGVAGLLRLGADALLGSLPLDPRQARQPLAMYLSQLLIALPVWLSHWRSIQRLVAVDAAGSETRSTTRRWYLYLVAFAAVAALLFSGARIVYELVLVALGEAMSQAERVETAHLVVNGAVAAVLLWYHWWLVLRADLAALRQAGRASTVVAVVAGLQAGDVETLERFVRESLDGARVRLYWTDEARVRETVEQLGQAGGD